MPRRRTRISDVTFDVFNFALMLIVFVIMTYPFIYILTYSLSNPAFLRGGLMLLPVGLNWSSYKVTFSNSDILNGLFISVARTTIGPIGMIIVTSMAGFVLTKDTFPGVKFLRKLFVFTMYFSGGIIPLYMVIRYLHLLGTFWVYIFPTLAAVFNMILIKTFIETLPQSLEEAAIIDGANDVQVFYRVVLPLCKPVIAAVTLFACVHHWNSFIDTQLYNPMHPRLFSLQYVLYTFLATQTQSVEQAKQAFKVERISPATLQMAITVVTILPILCVYPFLQKHFASGLLVGSIKG